jgi:CHASE2 domain-containing sensor protein
MKATIGPESLTEHAVIRTQHASQRAQKLAQSALPRDQRRRTRNHPPRRTRKETVPVERVRLDKDTVTENVTVNEEVRKENIETDGTDDTRR